MQQQETAWQALLAYKFTCGSEASSLPQKGLPVCQAWPLAARQQAQREQATSGDTPNALYRGGSLGPWECPCTNTGRATAMSGEAVGPEAMPILLHHQSAAALLPAAPLLSATPPTWMSAR